MTDQNQPNPYAYQGSEWQDSAKEVHAVAETRKFSRLGIWSFILSLFSIFGMFVLLLVAGFTAMNNPEIENNDSHPFIIAVGLVAIALALLGMLAFCLGVISFFMPRRKKLFGILGILFSLILAGFTVFVAIIGSVA